MNRWLVNAGAVALLFAPSRLLVRGRCRPTASLARAECRPGDTGLRENPQADAAKQGTDAAAEKKKAEDTANKSKLMKTHVNNGNNAMHDAQAIRQQIQTATENQRSALLAKMNADYQTAITEYQEALKNSIFADEDAIRPSV